MVFSGDRTPGPSGQTGRGPGSQRGSLVQRGQRSSTVIRRDVPSRLAGGNPSGAEASSGPPDTCRSMGRGVEEATGTPPSGTPGNLGRPPFILCDFCAVGPLRGLLSAEKCRLVASLARGEPVASPPHAAGTRSFGMPALPRVSSRDCLPAWTSSLWLALAQSSALPTETAVSRGAARPISHQPSPAETPVSRQDARPFSRRLVPPRPRRSLAPARPR